MASADRSGAVWFKSSHSGAQGDCVEVSFLTAHLTGVRDSKDPTGPVLVFAAGEWNSFAAALADGRLDWR
ncbi:DUF397 domain-containing protein [Nocardia sp. 2]|uniref:DUF397 domain-containing protein n=1 Tax=Nocardia acididurans TaxID=2802282 RepID=A0ABS1MFS6_9NOCA|nr:DUF397 domain-containing protein [Nocardia acididurans]MBL1079439.1 DUF397 domain-containing protein [Nocardia acididurans]